MLHLVLILINPMHTCNKYLTAFAALVYISVQTYSQHFIWNAGYFGFMDNREYFNDYVNDQTIFGSRISASAGFSLNDHNRFLAGADWLYEFGSKGEWLAPDVIIYYYGSRKSLNFFLGAFPRLDHIQMPMALMIDTFQYYRPNVEGMLLEFSKSSFRHNIWIDWTGRQSLTKREVFMLGFSGFASRGVLSYQHHFVMSHVAHSMQIDAGEHIRDNAGFSAMLGLNLTNITNTDSLALSAGFLGSYDRLRGVYDFNFPFGFLGEINMVYKGFGIHGTIYSGDSQQIISGDGFYKSGFYARTDVFYQANLSGIFGKLQFSFHFLPDAVDLSMSLVIRARIEGMISFFKANDAGSAVPVP
jgi:hypothetical protein